MCKYVRLSPGSKQAPDLPRPLPPLKPLTGNVNSIDHLITIQRAAREPWVF